jgi:3-oxoacyl-[acyl-carrier-protein] synthase II
MPDGCPAITGLGLHTVLGDDPRSTWDAILVGRRVVDHTAATIDIGPHRSRVAALAVRVATQAVRDAAWDGAMLADPRTALVVGTSKGEAESWIIDDRAASHSRTAALINKNAGPSAGGLCPDMGWGVGRLASIVAKHVRLGAGPVITLSAACASGLHALIRGCMMLTTGHADRVLVVAAEASVHPLFIESFRRLGVLPPVGFGCRPFDRNRNGFVMTEAGAAVCLERRWPCPGRHSIKSSNQRPYVLIDRYAITGDATHITASDPAGRSLRHMLTHVAIGDRPIDFVQAHGTGTVVNDPIELAAIDATVGTVTANVTGRRLPVFSHKSQLGHTLGASGLVGVVINSLAHRAGTIPGNAWTVDPLPTAACELSSKAVTTPIHRSLVTAAGFGGAGAVVGLRTPKMG